jgi:hypothetical protein
MVVSVALAAETGVDEDCAPAAEALKTNSARAAASLRSDKGTERLLAARELFKRIPRSWESRGCETAE